jgi:hypothetical protein
LNAFSTASRLELLLLHEGRIASHYSPKIAYQAGFHVLGDLAIGEKWLWGKVRFEI